MTNPDLQRNVTDELYWDPKIDSEEIAVSTKDGVVTLRGTVGSFRQRREAQRAAERVWGVKEVDSELEVRMLTEHRRDDAELRGEVLQALMLDSLVPISVDATVKNGLVTLNGAVDWQYQRDEAEFVAGNIVGISDVYNEIQLVRPTPEADDVQHAIKNAFTRDAKLDADSLVVSTRDGTVSLSGTVHSWSERDAAVAAAWAAPGVTSVDDRLTVSY
jgi:osmotically-inducible protein OsmY